MTAMAAEEEKNIAGLRASLAAAGVSYDKYRESIEGTINEREKLAFADDAQRDSLSRLVQMTGSLAEAQNLQTIAMDLARGKNMDLVAASELVGKVAAGNTGILGRYGIVLKEGATATEALDAISARFAGQSEAYSKTATAGWERFNNELANVQEDIGSALLPVMLELGTAMGDLFQEMQDSGALQAFGDVLRAIVGVAATGIGAFNQIRSAAEGMGDAIVTVARASMAAINGDLAGATDLMAGLMERSQERIDDAVAFTESTLERFADTAEASSGEAGDAVASLADRANAGYSDIADGAEETAVRVDAAMSDISDFFTRTAMSVEGNAAVYDAWAESVGESLIAAREAAQREGQALADAYEKTGSDMIDRFTDRVEGAQDVQDAWAESVGQAILDANEEAAKAQEQANKEILAEQEKVNNELLREQERKDKEQLRLQEQAAEDARRIAEKHAGEVATVTARMTSDTITQLDDLMKAGTISVEYGAGKMGEALRLVPEAVRENITVFDDFTLGLDGLSPEWVAALQPFVDMVNALPLETRRALGLDLEVWDLYTEQFKQLQEEKVTAVQAAQKAIADALAWKEETNAKLGAPAGGRSIGFGHPKGMPVPSDSPLFIGNGRPEAPFNPQARYGGAGLSINGTVNVYAKAGVEQTLNEIAAMRRY